MPTALSNGLVKAYRQILESGGKIEPKSDLELTIELGDQLKASGGFDDKANEYPDFREQYLQAKQATDRSYIGEVGAGLKRGASGLASTALGATALGLDIVGAKETARDVAEKARDMGNPDDAPTVGEMGDIVDTQGAVRYGLGKVGEVAPSLTEAMVTGILGSMAGTAAAPGAGSAAGAVAGVVGKRAVANLIKKQVAAKILGKEVSEEAVMAALKASGNEALKSAFVAESKALGARMGAGALNAINSYALSAGELYNSTGDAGLSMGAGAVAALPDTILPQIVLSRFFPGAVTEEAKHAAGGFVARLAKDAAKTIPVEAGTEAFQELVGIAAEKYKNGEPATLTVADLKRIREAAVGGAVGGAIAAPIAAAPSPEATPTEARQKAIDARRRAVTGQPAPVAAPVVQPTAPALDVNALSALTPEQQDMRIDALNRTSTRTELETKELAVLQALAAQRPSSVAQTASTSPQPTGVPEGQPPAAAPAAVAALPSQPVAAAGATPLVTDPTPPPVAAPAPVVLPTPKELGDRMRKAGSRLSQILASVPTVDATDARAKLEAVTKAETISAADVATFEAAVVALEAKSAVESARIAAAKVAQQAEKNTAKQAAADKKVADKAAKDAARAAAEAEAAAKKINAQPQEQAAPVAPDPLKQNLDAALNPAPVATPVPTEVKTAASPLPFKITDIVDARSPDLLRLDGQFGKDSRTASRVTMAFRDDTDTTIPEDQRPVVYRTVNNYSKAEGLKRLGKDAGSAQGFSVVAMGKDGKAGKVIAVGGSKQVLLEDVVKNGFTPIARITLDENHTGVVSRTFANTAEFDATVGATERTAKQTAVVESPGASSLPSHVFAAGDKAMLAAESSDPLAAAMTSALAPDPVAAVDVSTPGGKIAVYFDANPEVLADLAKRIESKDGNLEGARGALTRSFVEKKLAPAAGVSATDIMQHAVKAWMGAKVGARTDATLFRELLAKADPLAVEPDPSDATRYRQDTAVALPARARDAEHFNALLERLRNQGFDVELLQREAGQGQSAFVRDGRIGVVMEDVANANLTNIVGLIHEVGHTEVDRLKPGMRERLSRAVDRTMADAKDGQLIKAAKNANANWEEKLVETTAIRLAEEGFGADSKSLAATIWRTVKDAYYRVGMAMLKALGVEPSDAVVIRWYENNLRRRLGGDYDFRYVDLFAPYIERAAQRINRFTVIDGQSVANLLDPMTGTVRHAEVMPDTADAAEWNLNRYRLTREEAYYKGKKFSQIIAAVRPEDAPANINPNSIPLGAAIDAAYRTITDVGNVKAADGRMVDLRTPDYETARQIYGTSNVTEAQALHARAVHLVTHGDNRRSARPEKIAGVGLIVRTLQAADLVLDAPSADARTPGQRQTVYVKLYNTPDRTEPTWHFVRVDHAGRMITQHTAGPFGGYYTPNVEDSTVRKATGKKNEGESALRPRPQTKSIAPTEGAPAGLNQLNDLAALVELVNPSGWSKEKLNAVVIQSVQDGTITEEESEPLLGWIAQATPDQRKDVFKQGGGLRFSERDMGAEQDMDYTEAMARTQSSAIGALMPTLKKLKAELGDKMTDAEFWKIFGRGDQPAAIIDRLETRVPGSASATIGGEKMTDPMNQRARYQAFKLANALDRINVRRAAADEERIAKHTDKIVGLADRFNKVATQYRDANAMLSEFNDGMLGLVKELAVDLDRGPDTAFAAGKLLGAIREIEQLAPDAAIPEEYQRVFKALLDNGGTNTFDHLSAISRLNLNFGTMRVADIVTAIRENAGADPRLKSLAEQKPLMVALATLARTQSREMDLLQLRSMKDTAQYLSLKAELDEIRTASETRLEEIAKGIAATSDATSLRDRLRTEFLKARRDFNAAQRGIKRAQENKLMRTRFAEAMRERAVELSREVGAFSFWEARDGAVYRAMQRNDDGTWVSVDRTLRMVGDEAKGQHEQIATDLTMNRLWMEDNRDQAGSRLYEEVRRQVDELTRLDFAKNYEAAHRFWFDKWLQPLGQKFASTGEVAGTKVRQMLNRWQSVMFQHTDEVEAASRRWDHALQEAASAAGYANPKRFFDEVMGDVIYHIESEPGRDEAGALRAGRKAARARITGEVAPNFNDRLDTLLRAHRDMSELLVTTAEKNGVYIADPRVKDPLTGKGTLLRHAIKYGWMTSTRRLNGDVVQVLVNDMQAKGWAKGMFDTLTPDTDYAAVVQRYFAPSVVEKFVEPFVNKPGREVFFGAADKDGNASYLSQFDAQAAWQQAGGDVLAFIDLLYAKTKVEGGQSSADYRAAMLQRFGELYEMESRLAAQAKQTKGAFEGEKDGKSHRLMDGRTNDLIPPEHFRYDIFSPIDARRALTEIAFHASFGRDGTGMDAAITDLETSLNESARRYRMIPTGTRREMAAYAAEQGWDFKKLEYADEDLRNIQGWKAKLVKHFTGKEAVVGDARALLELMQLNTALVLNQPKSGLWNLLSLLEYPVIYRGLGKTSLRTTATAARVFGREVASSLVQAFGINLNRTADYAKEVADLVERRQTERLPIGTMLSDIGPDGRFAQGGIGNRVTQVSRGIQTAMRKGVGAGGFNALWAPFSFIGGKADTAIATANVQALEMIVKRAADFYAHNAEARANPAHRLTAKDLGMVGGWFSDEGAFNYFRERANDYGIGALEQLGREALGRRSTGGQLLSRDQALGAAMMALNEVSLQANVNTRPVEFIDNPIARMGGLMLGWPLAKMNQINDALKTPDGRVGFASVLRTLGVMAAWSLPAGLAYSLMMDQYDEKILGKKSNLRGIDPIALTPVVGPLLALGSERGVSNWLGIMERGARAGIYGLGADAVNSLANVVDPTSGQRDFDLNSRVLIFSQYANIRDSIRNLIHSDFEATYQSFGRPLLTTLGGGGVIQATQIVNNALGLSNGEAAVTNRINVSNWLRAAGREAGVELKAGGGRSSPTPLSVWLQQMQTMALSNDRMGFLEAYRHAVDVARQQGEADPEAKVLAGFKERDPLGAVFRTKPTEVEMAKLYQAMDDSGRRAVNEAKSLFASFTDMIAPNPIVHRMELQQKAQLRAAQPMTAEQLRRRAAQSAMGY